jgi:hypothetical protein
LAQWARSTMTPMIITSLRKYEHFKAFYSFVLGVQTLRDGFLSSFLTEGNIKSCFMLGFRVFWNVAIKILLATSAALMPRGWAWRSSTGTQYS